MSTAEKILATPVEEIVRMVSEAAKRQLKHGDTRYAQRVATTFRQQAAACKCQGGTCGSCRVLLASAADLERAP